MADFQRNASRSREPRGREKRGGSPRRSFGGGGRRSERRDSGRRDFGGRTERITMHAVTCDGCGVKCEVPFKPTAGKPVYCDDCFKKEGRKNGSSGKDHSRELEEINEKLDKIMRAMNL